MDNRHMQIDPGIQRRLDLCLFGLLAMGIILFLAHGCQAVTANGVQLTHVSSKFIEEQKVELPSLY